MNAHAKLSQDLNEDKDAPKQTQIAMVQSNDSSSRRIKRDIASLRDSTIQVSRRDIAVRVPEDAP